MSGLSHSEPLMVKPQASPKPLAFDRVMVMIFMMGGQSFGVPLEEVRGVIHWPHSLMVPSKTPFVNAVVWHEKDIMPVFDLAEMLELTVDSDPPLCLLVKHEDGPLAVRIDSDLPMLQSVDRSSIMPKLSDEAVTIVTGTFELDGKSMAMVHLSTLGKPQA